jgi:hypothetical protein
MNKKLLLEEINKFRRLTKLPLIVESEGEAGVIKDLWNIIFKDEAKAIEKGVFDVTTKEGKVVKLKPSYAKDLISKDIKVLSSEEKEAFVALHDNMVKDLGVEVVAKEIEKSLQAIPDTLQRKATERYLLDNYFNKTKLEIENKLKDIMVQNVFNNTGGSTVNDIAIPAITEIPFVPTNVGQQIQSELTTALQPLQHNAQAQIDFIANINPNYFVNYQAMLELEQAKMDFKTKQNLQPQIEKTKQMAEELKQNTIEVQTQMNQGKVDIQNLEKQKKQGEVDAQNLTNRGKDLDNQGKAADLKNKKRVGGLATAGGCLGLTIKIGAFILIGTALIYAFGMLKSCGDSLKELNNGNSKPGRLDSRSKSSSTNGKFDSGGSSGGSSDNKSNKGMLNNLANDPENN